VVAKWPLSGCLPSKAFFDIWLVKKKSGFRKKSPFFLENIFCVENYHYFWHWKILESMCANKIYRIYATSIKWKTQKGRFVCALFKRVLEDLLAFWRRMAGYFCALSDRCLPMHKGWDGFLGIRNQVITRSRWEGRSDFNLIPKEVRSEILRGVCSHRSATRP